MRYPINLFRDDEMKTIIQHYHQGAMGKALGKATKGDSLPDISKVSDSKDKKQGVEGKGVIALKAGGKKSGDDDFGDYGFKEGNTHVLKVKDIFIKEKGKAAFDKMTSGAVPAAPKVKGGAKGKRKAVVKKATKSASVKKQTGKILKYTPSRVASAGKKSTKKRAGHMPSPGGKQSAKQTTDQMTMDQFKKYLDWHDQRKGGKLGKRSAGKASASSGKGKRGK